MNSSFPEIPQSVLREINVLIFANNKIGAIKRYREETHCDLVDAKEAVEVLTEQLMLSDPASFQAKQYKGAGGLALFIAVLVVGVVAFKSLSTELPSAWTDKLDALIQTAQQKLIGNTVTPQAQAPEQLVDHESPYQPIAPADPKTDLKMLYRQKLSNPKFVDWMNQPGVPRGYQDFIEEHHIKYARAEISKNLILPPDTSTLTVPVVTDSAISIDGAIQHQEWLHAARVKLEPKESGSVLYMQADKDWLYLAADVPGDTTRSGYDQFRFYIHVDIDPALKNERIHVSGGRPEALGGIRETRVSWQGEPPKNKDESWKKYPLTDWRIYRLAMGASTLEQHRQFEAKLNLKESGLTIGSAFPAFVEIETDPLDDGKTRTRRYLGGLGNQNQPAWLILR